MKEKGNKRRHLKSVYPITHVFNVRRLIMDLGGASVVSRRVGLHRQTVHRWVRSGVVSTSAMELLRSRYKHLNFDPYFEPLVFPIDKDEAGMAVVSLPKLADGKPLDLSDIDPTEKHDVD